MDAAASTRASRSTERGTPASSAPSASSVADHRGGQRLQVVAALEHGADRHAQLVGERAHVRAPSPRTRRSRARSSRAGRRDGRRSRPTPAPAPARTPAPPASRRARPATSHSSSPDPGGTGRLIVKPSPSPAPTSRERARAGIEAATGGWLANSTSRRLVEDVVRPVAVVHVPVEHEHPREPERVERVPRGHRHVVEQAEAHRARAARRGGPAGAAPQKPDARLAAEQRVHQRARRRPPRAAPPPRSRREATVSGSNAPPPARDASRDRAPRSSRGCTPQQLPSVDRGRLAALVAEPVARAPARSSIAGMRPGPSGCEPVSCSSEEAWRK